MLGVSETENQTAKDEGKPVAEWITNRQASRDGNFGRVSTNVTQNLRNRFQ